MAASPIDDDFTKRVFGTSRHHQVYTPAMSFFREALDADMPDARPICESILSGGQCSSTSPFHRVDYDHGETWAPHSGQALEGLGLFEDMQPSSRSETERTPWTTESEEKLIKILASQPNWNTMKFQNWKLIQEDPKLSEIFKKASLARKTNALHGQHRQRRQRQEVAGEAPDEQIQDRPESAFVMPPKFWNKIRLVDADNAHVDIEDDDEESHPVTTIPSTFWNSLIVVGPSLDSTQTQGQSALGTHQHDEDNDRRRG